MVKVKNHYNIDLDFSLENSCYKSIRKDWIFDQEYKNFITEATISLTPTENHILTNIDEEQKITYETSGSNPGAVIIPAGSYTLTELLGRINTAFVMVGIANTLSVITEGANFGKCELEINRYVNFSLAPQIRQILKLEVDYEPADTFYITDEVIDITRNLQNIKLFCSLLNASSSRIANQNNDLLCTINLESLEEPHIETIRNLSVPVFNRVNSISLYFQDENLQDIKMNCNVHITLHINSYDANQDDKTANAATKDRAQFLTQFTNLSFELTKANESIQLPETVNLPSNTFIERVSVLLDGHIHNILEDQVVIIDGVEVLIPAGSYGLEDLLAELNVTSTAMFSAIYEGEKAFHVEITDYNLINFQQAYQLQKLLGINSSVIQSTENALMYPITNKNNCCVVNYRSVDYELRIPEGNYTYSDFLVRLTEKLNEVVPIKSVGFIDNNLSDPINPICGEIKFISDDPDHQAYFNRIHASNTLQNYPWTRFFLNAKNIKNLSLARADENLPRRNDATFLDDTYIDYDYVLYPEVQHYFDDVIVKYKMESTDNVTCDCEGEFTLSRGSKTMRVLRNNIVDQLNVIYQEARNITSSHSEAIAFTTQDGNKYQIDILYNQTFSPNLSKLEVTCGNSPTTGDFFISRSRAYRTNYWYASKTQAVSGVHIPQDINLKITIDQTGTTKTYTIPKNDSIGITDIAKIIQGFLDNLFGISDVYKCNNPQGKIQIARISSAVSPISVECDKAWFPFQGRNITSLVFRMYRNAIIKLPNLLTREALFNFIYTTGKTYINANDDDFFNSYTQDSQLNRRQVFKANRNIRCQYCNPVTLERISPRFLNNFADNLASINSSNKEAFDVGTVVYDFGGRNVVLYDDDNTFTFTQGSKTLKGTYAKGGQTQHEFILNLNAGLANAEVPLQFTMGFDGYYASNSTCSLQGLYLTNGVFGILQTRTQNNVTTFFFPYEDNMTIYGFGSDYYCSENLIDITFGREILNIYSDIINGKIDSKITSMEITDLQKNYLSRKTIIPVRNSFNRIKFVLKDSNERDYEINGRLFITLHLSTL